MHRKKWALFPLICLPLAAAASNLLEEIVVTASRHEQRVFDSSATLDVIDERTLSRSTVHALADLLRDVPGLRVSDSGQAGLKRLRIRGEESRRSAVLIDSQELTDHFEVGTPLTLHPSMVERVEVIRGSGAVLYGSRALGGVVNFLTRKGGERPFQFTLSGGYDFATSGATGFASAYGNLNGFEYRLAYAESDQEERDTPRGEVENTAFDNSNAYLFAGRGFGAHRLEYSYENYDSSADIFVEEAVRTTFPLTDFYLETPRRDREKHSGLYRLDIDGDWLKRLRLSAFRQVSDREFFTRTDTVWYRRAITSISELTSEGGLLQLDSRELGGHRLIGGLQYLRDAVDQRRHVDTFSWTPGTPSGIEMIDDEAEIGTLAWFVRDEWSGTDRLTLSAGLRQYFVEAELGATDRTSLSPGKLDDRDEVVLALGAVYEPRDELRLRLNVSEGFVYPSLLQLATGAYAGSRYVNPDTGLQPETSINYEAGLRLRGSELIVDLTTFYNVSEDYIHHLPCAPDDNCPGSRDRLYQNVGESQAHGVELFAQYEPAGVPVRPYANVAWIKRKNKYDAFSTWDSGVAEFGGRAGLRWDGKLETGGGAWAAWADLFVRGESSSQLMEPGTTRTVLEDKSSWWTVNLAAGASLGRREHYRLALELYNLTDETYISSGENLYGPKRSAAVKVTVDF